MRVVCCKASKEWFAKFKASHPNATRDVRGEYKNYLSFKPVRLAMNENEAFFKNGAPFGINERKAVRIFLDFDHESGVEIMKKQPWQAWAYVLKILMNDYSKKEIDGILRSYDSEEWRGGDFNQNQLHKELDSLDTALVFRGCYEYDLNSAYPYELALMFPKSFEGLEKAYRRRKTNPNIKYYLNVFTGLLKAKGYVGAYAHIVHKVRQRMESAIAFVGGHRKTIYENTDGFIVVAPKRKLPTSDRFGDWKLEYTGAIIMKSNPFVFQREDGLIKGRMSIKERKGLNLWQGKHKDFRSTAKSKRTRN